MSNETPEQIGSDVNDLREAKKRLSDLDARANAMKANLGMAIKVIDGSESLAYDNTGNCYRLHTRPRSGEYSPGDPFTVPTPVELVEFVEERSKVKEQVDSLSRKFKDLF